MSFIKRLRQIGMVFSFTAKRDKWFVPLVIAAVASVVVPARKVTLPVGLIPVTVAVRVSC